MSSKTLRNLAFAALTAAVVAACGKDGPAAPPQLPPPEVGVAPAKAQAVPLTQDLVGRVSAVRSADVRARVAGVLLKRTYVEGSDVKEGDLMFQIDPAPLQATLNVQLANLAAAQATYENNHVAADRARSVGAKGLMARSDVDNAVAAERTSAAAVKQEQANVESARINLGYARVVAPIAGRSGQQQVTEGALVGQTEATLLTTVEQIDPVYVNFSQAIGQIDAMRQAAAKGSVKLADKAKVELLGADGATRGIAGTLDFADEAVDAATGAVSLRAVVPNADHALLPGQYVNVRLTAGEMAHAWIVPQTAVLRDANGPYVFVVGADGKAAQKRIKTEVLRGSDWIVTDGLTDGDSIIVAGVMKVQPGMPVRIAPAQPAANAAPATPAAAH